MSEPTASPTPTQRTLAENSWHPGQVNPWGVALLVFGGVLLVLAAVQYGFGSAASTATFDNPTGLDHEALAAVHYEAAAALAVLAVVTVIVWLGAAAARWRPNR